MCCCVSFTDRHKQYTIMSITKRFRPDPFLLLSGLQLLLPALYNRYPLVNADTATYLASGFKPETPFDRPITYGLLARLFSLNGASLWLVVYAQALLVAHLLYIIIKQVMGASYRWYYGVGMVLLLSLGTGLSWVVCQVQPDIFTAIGLLCIVALLISGHSRGTRIYLYILFFVAVATHLSHPLLFVSVLAALWVLRRVYVSAGNLPVRPIRFLVLAGLALGSIALMGAALSKSKHVYFTGTLLEKGVLKKYLDDKCPTTPYKLCAYKDALPATSDEFIWTDSSPLYKIGSWQGTKTEFNTIGNDVLTTPAYLGIYLAATARQAGQQAVTYGIGVGNDPFGAGTNVQLRIAEYFPKEAGRFAAARQNTAHLLPAFVLPNKLFTVVLLMSLAVMVVALLRWRHTSGTLKILMAVCLIGVMFNILDCAAFTVVNGRYGCKTLWLVPLCAVLYLLGQKKGRGDVIADLPSQKEGG